MKKRSISVIYDPNKPNMVSIGSSDGKGDPWEDLGLLLEGVGVLTKACMNAGILEHNGQPLNEYIKKYIDEVCNDYKAVVTIIK